MLIKKLPKICYIDNESTKPFHVRRLLKEIAHEVDFFSNSQEAKAAIRTTDYPLLIVNGSQSRIADGTLKTLLGEIKQLLQQSEDSTRIAALTDSTNKETLKILQHMGVSIALKQPVSEAQLEKMLHHTRQENSPFLTLIDELGNTNQTATETVTETVTTQPRQEPVSASQKKAESVAKVETVVRKKAVETKSAPQKKPVQKEKKKGVGPLLILGLGLGLLIGLGVFWNTFQNLTEPKITTVLRGPIEERVLLDGIVALKGASDVFAQSDQRVKSIEVSDGTKVKKGDVILRFDASDFEQSVNRSQSRLRKLKNKIDKSADRVKRMKEALEFGAVSERSVQDAQTELDKLLAEKRTLESRVRSAQSNLQQLELVAPGGGIVTKVKTSVGAKISAGDLLYSFASEEEKELKIVVPQNRATLFQIGQPVQMQAHPNWRGQLARFVKKDGVIEAAYLSLGTLSKIVSVGEQLKVDVFLGKNPDALLVPRATVYRQGETWFVAVVEQGKARHKVVDLGLQNLTHVQVLSGLREGQSLVVGEGGVPEEGSRVRQPVQ
ncbi:MAG: efflux RND transporter periplasmic adaptor subunit [Gammaproteobacteria bacterium]|nr:efflux RND transporter periplasmic adaptor subunit [Gammaproteobacteria bacterium]